MQICAHSPRAVLFDLDDTLFDHQQSAREALTRVHRSHRAFMRWPFGVFERVHARVLEELHAEVLVGARGLDDAREERFRRLLAESDPRDVDARDTGLARVTAQMYRDAYVAARRPIKGAVALLAALHPLVRIAIVSNNLLAEQQAKLRVCGFDPYVGALVVSEAVGVAKPDPRIFDRALDALGCAAADAVMIGDSWPADIVGARAAGIRPIWFNRAGRRAPEAAHDVREVAALVPMDAVMAAIFHPDAPSDIGADSRCASA